jgi:hypothetical protein
MNVRVSNALQSTQRAVTRLIEKCRKGGPLYAKYPQLVDQANRTAKWLLNAVNALRQKITTSK